MPFERPEAKARPAIFNLCPVCKLILSHNPRKLHRVGNNVFVHKGCYELTVRKVAEQGARAKSDGRG